MSRQLLLRVVLDVVLSRVIEGFSTAKYTLIEPCERIVSPTSLKLIENFLSIRNRLTLVYSLFSLYALRMDQRFVVFTDFRP